MIVAGFIKLNSLNFLNLKDKLNKIKLSFDWVIKIFELYLFYEIEIVYIYFSRHLTCFLCYF